MNNNATLYGVIGLLSGILLTVVYFGLNNNSHMMGMGMMGGGSQMMRDEDHMEEMMENMVGGLNHKTGEEFDKEFLSEMIVHHQGAIDMANLAIKSATHKEIIDLSKKIIDAQTAEIETMKTWQKDWNY